MIRRTLFIVMLLGVVADWSHAVITSDEVGSHVVTPGKESFGVNADGVVIVGELLDSGEPFRFCSGALITDRHVLSAAHCFDDDENGQVDPLLSLFPHEIVFDLPDGLVAIQYSLTSIRFPDSWPTIKEDLAIVELEEDAPAGVPRYPLYGSSDEVGKPFVLVGYGDPGHGATGFDETFDELPTKRAGLNRYDAVRDDLPGVEFLSYDFDSGMEENNSLHISGFESDLGFGADEVLSWSGDSGAPSFIDGVIAVVTAFGARLPSADFTDQPDGSWGEAGFDVRVSTFREFIDTATSGAAVFVSAQPEDRGDFDNDGDVDSDDFLIWQANFGTQVGATPNTGDANGDGAVNGDDFLIWQAQFGSSTLAPAAAPIPEPTTAALVALLWVVLATRRRTN